MKRCGWKQQGKKNNSNKKTRIPLLIRFSILDYNINKNMSANYEQNLQNFRSQNKLKNKYIPKTSDQSDGQQYELKLTKTHEKHNFFETRPKSQRWTAKENKLYLKFLQDHGSMFRYKSVRRVKQIYSLLSQKMGGKRTASQCKSHHLKMKKATLKGTVKEIMNYIKGKIYLDQIKEGNKEKLLLEVQDKNHESIQENQNLKPKLSEEEFEMRVNKWSRSCNISISICLDTVYTW